MVIFVYQPPLLDINFQAQTQFQHIFVSQICVLLTNINKELSIIFLKLKIQ